MPSRFERTQRQKFRQLAKRQLRTLRDDPRLSRATDAGSALLTSFDEIAETAPEKAKWECSAGCSFCCHMPVHLSAVEAVLLSSHIHTHFPEPRRQETIERIRRAAEAIGALTEHEFKNSRTPCALLDGDGRCSAYEARPLACRGFHSTSVDACRASFDSNDHRCDEARDRMTEDLCARMVVALHSVSSAGTLGDRRFELHSAVIRLLESGPKAPVTGKEVARMLEGARSKASPLDVPLNSIIARFREP